MIDNPWNPRTLARSDKYQMHQWIPHLPRRRRLVHLYTREVKSLKNIIQFLKSTNRIQIATTIIETLEKKWNMFRVNNKETWTTSLTYLKTCFTTFSSVLIVYFKHVLVCWGKNCQVTVRLHNYKDASKINK